VLDILICQENPVVQSVLEIGLKPKQQPEHKGNIMACPQIQQKTEKKKNYNTKGLGLFDNASREEDDAAM